MCEFGPGRSEKSRASLGQGEIVCKLVSVACGVNALLVWWR